LAQPILQHQRQSLLSSATMFQVKFEHSAERLR
jgi:hypothetical protein